MKNKWMTATTVLLFLLSMSSVAQLYEKNTYVNFGFGFSGWGIPVYAGIDFTVADNITAGGEVSYRTYDESNYWDHTIFVLSANGNYHFKKLMNLPPDFDIYAGLSVGYAIWNSTYQGPGSEIEYGGNGGSDVFLAAQLGSRYFFLDNWAVQIELGGGSVSGGKLGITYWLPN